MEWIVIEDSILDRLVRKGLLDKVTLSRETCI